MGTSGYGKSTLLDILAGKKQPYQYNGNVYINGHPIKDDKNYLIVTGYVQQADIMPELWTV